MIQFDNVASDLTLGTVSLYPFECSDWSSYGLSDEDKQRLPINARHRRRSPDAELFSVINATLVVDIEY